ncbi:MAG: dual specificity protein phosphatase family protein, partial [Hydrococcus sp. RM1_1_31]|nr:dual specificity protein phosphatase family protein [Hydrococcus sp. RM1_1_31]
FIIGYLMKYHSKSFDQAYTLVKDKRKIINPKFKFFSHN